MAHPAQRQFFERVRERFPDAFTGVEVLEVGSLDINGTVRDLFSNTVRYIGVDVGEGKGVDLVAHGENLDFDDSSFDTAISAECFEHNPEWAATFANMHRMAKQFVMFSCASDGRPEHGTTRTSPGSSPLTASWDYYRNLNEADFRAEFPLDEMFAIYEFEYNPASHDLYFWGIKRIEP